MFTGLVSDVGAVVARHEAGDVARFTIACRYPASDIGLGASIACDGCCLTATAVREDGEGATEFEVDVSPETLRLTTLGDWRVGTRVNLERSLRVGDELGGHIVSGHVDGVAVLAERVDDGETSRFTFEAPPELARFIAAKGSVALNGTSLTVNGVEGARFWLTLIPHTLAATTWGGMRDGDGANLEIDMLARYVARLREME
ncbi:riboflavin synthase [Lutibaculum baratangense]|uniref:Riboflavin synthase n=1 Tax=Lutibaculum baratangense AMV1 TaxID=631454 RepID=V4T9U1_9HYPH|nr:riboflavin synthase [Lutibaculum baratangense]ESR23268.1 Riboflavin synthase eubacterial/eukaryotic [Lutibaculum baratangense AMV1]